METSFFSRGRAALGKTLDVSLVPAMGLILWAQIKDTPAATLILLAVGVLYTTRNVLAEEARLRNLRFNWLDIATLVVMVSEVINYFSSTYRVNTLVSLADASFLLLFYWTIRVNLKYEYQLVGLILIVSVIGLYLTGNVLYAFWSQYDYLAYLRFDDITGLRERLEFAKPDARATAEWITLFLMFLPFPVLLLIRYRERLRVVLLPAVCCVLVTLIAIAVTFSRALYLSALSFFLIGSVLCLYYRLFSLRQLLVFNGLLTLTFWVFIAFSPIAKPVVTTMSILRTQSQVRSLQGRVNTWTTALEMTRSRPLLGIGSYNFPMQYVAYRPANTVYVSRALNLFLQILIERGVLGLVVFGFLLVTFFKTSFQQLRLNGANVFEKSAIVLFVAASASAIIRDLSYFSILSNKGVATLLCLMFACNASLPLSPSKLLPAKKSLVGFFSILVLIAFVFISLKYSHVPRNESDDNAYYVSNKALLLASTATANLTPETIREHRIEFGKEERSRIQQAVVLYNRALELNPADDVFHHNLGWLHYFLGQTQLAITHIQRSIELSSDVALYHVNLGLIYESTGESDKAASEYTFALRLSPGLVDSAFFKDFQNRLPAEAEKSLRATTSYFEEQLASGSDPIANAGLGKLYLYEGRVDEATKRLQDATAQLPSLSRAWINLGQCYELAGNESEAKLAYERALYLDDGNYSALDHLGNLAYRQQQSAQAIAYYERALNRFQRQSSIHSERVFRIYRAKQIVTNDIVPARLLAYSAPAFDRGEIYVRLMLLHRANGDIARANYFDGLKAALERQKLEGIDAKK